MNIVPSRIQVGGKQLFTLSTGNSFLAKEACQGGGPTLYYAPESFICCTIQLQSILINGTWNARDI